MAELKWLAGDRHGKKLQEIYRIFIISEDL